MLEAEGKPREGETATWRQRGKLQEQQRGGNKRKTKTGREETTRERSCKETEGGDRMMEEGREGGKEAARRKGKREGNKTIRTRHGGKKTEQKGVAEI